MVLGMVFGVEVRMVSRVVLRNRVVPRPDVRALEFISCDQHTLALRLRLSAIMAGINGPQVTLQGMKRVVNLIDI